MQLLSAQLRRVPIFGFQTGAQIGITTDLIIDPDKLRLAAFSCQGHGQATRLLLPQDVRQSGPDGFIVDSEDTLAEPDDIVRLQPLLKRPFKLIGLVVVTQLGQRLGRVEEFTLDPSDYRIQKIHVHRPILRSLWEGSLVIDRSQITEITHRQLVVKDGTVPVSATSRMAEPSRLRS